MGPRQVFHNSLKNYAVSAERLGHRPAVLVHGPVDQQREPLPELQRKGLQIPFAIPVHDTTISMLGLFR